MSRKYNLNNLFLIYININENNNISNARKYITIVEEKNNEYIDLFHPNFTIPYKDFEKLVNNNIISYSKPLSIYLNKKTNPNKHLSRNKALRLAWSCYNNFDIDYLENEYQKNNIKKLSN